jgi:hypothetical protein
MHKSGLLRICTGRGLMTMLKIWCRSHACFSFEGFRSSSENLVNFSAYKNVREKAERIDIISLSWETVRIVCMRWTDLTWEDSIAYRRCWSIGAKLLLSTLLQIQITLHAQSMWVDVVTLPFLWCNHSSSIEAIGRENWYFRIRPKAQRENSNLQTAKGLKEMGLPHFVK